MKGLRIRRHCQPLGREAGNLRRFNVREQVCLDTHCQPERQARSQSDALAAEFSPDVLARNATPESAQQGEDDVYCW